MASGQNKHRPRSSNGVSVDPDELYIKGEKIGGGSFGTVFRATDRRTGSHVAIKEIDLDASDDDVDVIIQEIQILSQMRSRYVTQYFGSYLNKRDLWIVMEYCGGGSCADLLKSGPIPEEYIAIIIRDILHGLDYIHSEKKIHRDIKAANILLTSHGDIKLADFGVSGQLTATTLKKRTLVGSPYWMAPEVIECRGYDFKADIWSLGITAIELAKAEVPLSGQINPMEVLFMIPKNPPPKLEGNFSKSCMEFVDSCLKMDPKERPCAKELLGLKFIVKAKSSTKLTDLIIRKEKHIARVNQRRVSGQSRSSSGHGFDNNFLKTDDSSWNFGTMRATESILGPRQDNIEPVSDRFNTLRIRRNTLGTFSKNTTAQAQNQLNLRIHKRRMSPQLSTQLPEQLPPVPPIPDRLEPSGLQKVLSHLDLNSASSSHGSSSLSSVDKEARRTSYHSNESGGTPKERRPNRNSQQEMKAALSERKRHSGPIQSSRRSSPTSSPRPRPTIQTPRGLQDVIITDDDDDGDAPYVPSRLSTPSTPVVQQRAESRGQLIDEDDIFRDNSGEETRSSEEEEVLGVFEGLIIPALVELDRRAKTDRTRMVVQKLANSIKQAEQDEPGIGETFLEELWRAMKNANIVDN
ncbi:kinase-like domain-containing protein [Lipomyces oligophaga]|uniref:kinase-like domain-containing protein n=1 Tax=Lipomyces oligophaga TaxID=45792 RepID=UPI0034CDA2AB